MSELRPASCIERNITTSDLYEALREISINLERAVDLLCVQVDNQCEVPKWYADKWLAKKGKESWAK